MDLQSTEQDINHAWYCKSSQLNLAIEVMSLGGEPNTATFLNQKNS